MCNFGGDEDDRRTAHVVGVHNPYTQTPPVKSAREVADQSARDLARLVERELGHDVDPVALRLFIRAYWTRVSKFAHDIHAEP